MSGSQLDIQVVYGSGSGNLDVAIKTAITSGNNGLLQYYGDSVQHERELCYAMRAIRRDFLLGGGGTGTTHEDQIESSIGRSLVDGVNEVLRRFGNRDGNRVLVNQAFEAHERMLTSACLRVSPTKDYERKDDEDDDEDDPRGGPKFKMGTSWGNMVKGCMVGNFGRGEDLLK